MQKLKIRHLLIGVLLVVLSIIVPTPWKFLWSSAGVLFGCMVWDIFSERFVKVGTNG